MVLDKSNRPAVVTYLYLWMLKMEQAQQNQFRFELPTFVDMERDTEAKGFAISRRTIRRHIEQLKMAGLLDKYSGPIL
jgi:hypothetical protein